MKTLTALALPALATALILACSPSGTETPKPSTTAEAGPVQTVTSASFQALVSGDKPVLLDFWAPWCGPCRTQGPLVDQAAGLAGGRALFGKVNVDEQRELAKRFGVEAIPTLIVFRGGKEVQRFVGVQQPETLLQALGAR
nr:thioredoxin [uncultured Holophaga sp.]